LCQELEQKLSKKCEEIASYEAKISVLNEQSLLVAKEKETNEQAKLDQINNLVI
jgi:hypothetical protein